MSTGKPQMGLTEALTAASPLLLSMGQNMQTPPAQRDPRVMQQGLMAMMQQMQEKRKREEWERTLGGMTGGGAGDAVPGQTGGYNPDAAIDPRMRGILAQLGPEKGAGVLAQIMSQRPQTSEFERLTQGMDPAAVERARRVKLGLEPDADTTLRVGATNQGPSFRTLTPEEAQRAGVPAGQIDERTGRIYPINPPQGMTIESDGAGGFRMVQGAGAAQRPLTEGQSKDVVYSTRARGALEAFEPVANAMTSIADRALNMDPTGQVRGKFQSSEFQVAQNAGNEFLQAILRKDTGAAITSQEQELYGQTYIPQPGDGPEVLEEKRRARLRAINAIEAGMSPAQMVAQERGLQRAKDAAIRGGASPEDLEYLTPEEMRLFDEGGEEATNPSAPVRKMSADGGLVDAIIWQESRGNPNAVGPMTRYGERAQGAAQIMPATARDPGFGVAPVSDPFDPNEARRFAGDYIGAMLERYKGDQRRALAAYNWGPRNVDRWDGRLESLPAETRNYILSIERRLGRSA